MGHYDSCRDETWKLKDTKCTGKKAKKGEHVWKDEGHGVQTCKHCKKTIYYT